MDMEFDSAGEEPRDRTRWIWIGIVAFVLIAGFALWIINRTDPAVSRVRVMHILIRFDATNPDDRAQAFETISRLRDRIEQGESFRALARQYSNDPSSARRGGDLGYLKRGQLSDSLEKFAWSANLNELSDILLSPYGYHLVVTLDRYLAPADIYQKELEERVLQEMREERTDPSSPVGQVREQPSPAEPPANVVRPEEPLAGETAHTEPPAEDAPAEQLFEEIPEEEPLEEP
jgi:hypothetical protein